jgi:hypothetical protein
MVTCESDGLRVIGAGMPDLDGWEEQLRAADTERAGAPQRIADLCAQRLGVGGAGISMVSDTGNHAVICATDDVSARIEELQVTLGEGPCVDAVARGGPVLVADLADPTDRAVERWPAFLGSATEAGVRAVFAFPLQIGAIQIGALDLYRARPGALSEGELSAALLATESASLGLLAQQATGDGLADVDDLSSYDAKIHQATGMITVQLDVPIEQAFLLLRARAFSTGRALHEVAALVVERRMRFTPEDR